MMCPAPLQVERVYKRETGAKVLEAWPNEYFLEQVGSSAGCLFALVYHAAVR